MVCTVAAPPCSVMRYLKKTISKSVCLEACHFCMSITGFNYVTLYITDSFSGIFMM